MTIWNTRQGHNDRVRVGPAETNLRRRYAVQLWVIEHELVIQ